MANVSPYQTVLEVVQLVIKRNIPGREAALNGRRWASQWMSKRRAFCDLLPKRRVFWAIWGPYERSDLEKIDKIDSRGSDAASIICQQCCQLSSIGCHQCKSFGHVAMQGLMLDCGPLDWEVLDQFPAPPAYDGAAPPLWLALDEIMDPVRPIATLRWAKFET
eukprot:scaffold290637_cov17-Prasinocladus_malaysianus.AAC.1